MLQKLYKRYLKSAKILGSPIFRALESIMLITCIDIYMYRQAQGRQHTEAVCIQKPADKTCSACVGFVKTLVEITWETVGFWDLGIECVRACALSQIQLHCRMASYTKAKRSIFLYINV